MSEWENGLPPVGEVVEYQCGCNGEELLYQKAVLRFHHLDEVAFTLEDNGIYVEKKSVFAEKCRSLKTEAERQRESELQILENEIAMFYMQPTWNHTGLAEMLLDAGYRNVTPLSDERLLKKFPESENDWVDLLIDAKRQGAKWARDFILGGKNHA